MRSAPGSSTNTISSSCPILLDRGIRVLPANVTVELDLLDKRRFQRKRSIFVIGRAEAHNGRDDDSERSSSRSALMIESVQNQREFAKIMSFKSSLCIGRFF